MADEQSPDTQPSTPDPGSPEYDASAITVLEGLEAVRKRPGMYIGSTGERGLHHLVWEIVDNSVDESMAGYADTIDVTLMEDGAVRVKDNGRGIPTDIHEAEGVSAVELVLTQLHAGGKFGGGGYKVSGGLHGVGSSVVNALSDWLKLKIYRGGKRHEMEFRRGDAVSPLVITGDAPLRPNGEPLSGTEVSFLPSTETFSFIEFDRKTLEHRLRELAFLNSGVTIWLKDFREAEPFEDLAYAADLDGVALGQPAGAVPQAVLEPHPDVRPHGGRHRGHRHLVAAGTQDRPAILLAEQPVGRALHVEHILGMRADAAQDAEHGLHEQGRGD